MFVWCVALSVHMYIQNRFHASKHICWGMSGSSVLWWLWQHTWLSAIDISNISVCEISSESLKCNINFFLENGGHCCAIRKVSSNLFNWTFLSMTCSPEKQKWNYVPSPKANGCTSLLSYDGHPILIWCHILRQLFFWLFRFKAFKTTLRRNSPLRVSPSVTWITTKYCYTVSH